MFALAAALLTGPAAAADVVVVAPDGAPWAGERTSLEVAVAEAGAPVRGARVELEATRGRVIGAGAEVAPGRYRFGYVAPGTGSDLDELRVLVPGVAPVRWPLPVRPAAASRLGAARDVESVVGTSRIELRFPSAEPPDPEDVLVRVSEGRILEVRREEESVAVVIEPGAQREARVIGVLALDLRRPGAAPAAGTVRLRARHSGNVTAEPGSKVTLRVGGRSFGPFVADASGSANVVFDAEPGVSGYEIAVSDDLGNTQKLQSPLPAVTTPSLAWVDLPGETGAAVFLGAWSPGGAAWSGMAPGCRVGVSEREVAVALARGLYRLDVVDDDALFELRGDCLLGESVVPFRVRLGTDRPSRVELRVYPESLDADFPIAEAQATLLDVRGERLPPDDVVVRSDHGEVEVTRARDALRAEYRGGQAVTFGSDTLRASWSLPAGSGEPWTTRVHATPSPESIDVAVRVLDREGRPLSARAIEVRAGTGLATLTSDSRGWARAVLARPAGELWVVRALAGNAAGEAAVFRAVEKPLPAPDAPDLTAAVPVSIRAGRVRQVFLDVNPRPLVTGTGQEGVIEVRLLDGGGNLVRDEQVLLSASLGEVGPVSLRPDGTHIARYSPPPGISARTVRIIATSTGSTVSTDLELVPRPVRGTVGASVGWLTNFGSVSAPVFGLQGDYRLPLPLLAVRLGVSAYVVDATVPDGATGRDVAVRGEFFPVDVGAALVQRGPRWSFGAGVSLAVVPYALSVDFGSDRGLSGPGVSPPGVLVTGSAGYRLSSSEVFAQAGYLLFTTPAGAVSFEGGVGGLSLSAGYRVLY